MFLNIHAFIYSTSVNWGSMSRHHAKRKDTKMTQLQFLSSDTEITLPNQNICTWGQKGTNNKLLYTQSTQKVQRSKRLIIKKKGEVWQITLGRLTGHAFQFFFSLPSFKIETRWLKHFSSHVRGGYVTYFWPMRCLPWADIPF